MNLHRDGSDDVTESSLMDDTEEPVSIISYACDPSAWFGLRHVFPPELRKIDE